MSQFNSPSMLQTKLRIYLAGPDVFTRDPIALAEKKRDICARYGFEGVFPLDNNPELLTQDHKTPFHKALKISRANEQLMQTCDVLIANMTPFRGPNADTGTAYEMGYMRALGKPVFAYANVYTAADGLSGRQHIDRVRTYYGAINAREDGQTFEDPKQQMMVEDFGMVDNLMLDSAVFHSGGEIVVTPVSEDARYTDLKGFEECVRQAAAELLPATYDELDLASEISGDIAGDISGEYHDEFVYGIDAKPLTQ